MLIIFIRIYRERELRSYILPHQGTHAWEYLLALAFVFVCSWPVADAVAISRSLCGAAAMQDRPDASGTRGTYAYRRTCMDRTGAFHGTSARLRLGSAAARLCRCRCRATGPSTQRPSLPMAMDRPCRQIPRQRCVSAMPFINQHYMPI